MLNRECVSSTTQVLSSIVDGLGVVGSLFGFVEGILELTTNEVLKDRIGESIPTRICFGAVLLLATTFLAVYSFRQRTAVEEERRENQDTRNTVDLLRKHRFKTVEEAKIDVLPEIPVDHSLNNTLLPATTLRS